MGDPQRAEKAEIDGVIGAPTPEEIYEIVHAIRGCRLNHSVLDACLVTGEYTETRATMSTEVLDEYGL